MVAFVTSLPALNGVPIHITVYDQAGVALNPADITWSTSPFAGGGAMVADATGFSFTGTVNNITTWRATHVPSGVSSTLAISVTSGVTGLQFSSP